MEMRNVTTGAFDIAVKTDSHWVPLEEAREIAWALYRYDLAKAHEEASNG
jgi:hypothetical protein